MPTVNRVKALYGILNEKVDTAFGKGLLTFNKACKDAEAMAINEQDDLKSVYLASQVGCSWILELDFDWSAGEDRRTIWSVGTGLCSSFSALGRL